MKRQIVFCLMMGILLMPGFLSVSLQAQETTDAQPPITQRKIDVYNVKELVANQYNDPQVWMDHLENDLMKFWGNKANTVGKSDFFPTFRANDGTVVSGKAADWPQEYQDALYDEETNGLVADAGIYNYIRAHSRQTFAYGIAFNMTGKVDYLKKMSPRCNGYFKSNG
ncbi:MAG: hypothetical protein LUI85_06565 [Bacteroides sp.]|nr:hypothetical protein [Bacteroides sp.]